jgi:NAD(P)-dependent dehydrogenase (short-subunit alcohol dehydrogenase family)
MAHKKVAIVTGGGGEPDLKGPEGTGRAIARSLARAGYHLLIVDRDERAGSGTRDVIEGEGGTAACCVADVSVPEQCERAVAAAIAAFGRLDVLVNNAALVSNMQGHVMTDAEWTRVLDVNLKGAMFMSRWALEPFMVQGSGVIINIASAAGMRSFRNPAYAASKAGLIGLTTDLAGSYGPHGVRVNAVVPGTVLTPMAERFSGSIDRAARLKLTPLQTEGRAADVAAAVLFLCSDEARWITGVTLPVDAGMLTLPPRL